ncbi:MAG: aspartate kinase, partial [Bacteroidales bacterium]
MKVLKFGGTSVGSPERMKALPSLIVNKEPKIVVLSAMSGTTNSLVEIASLFYQGKMQEIATAIKNIEERYAIVIEELYTSEEYKNQATTLMKERFDMLRNFTVQDFSEKDERVILAQGELMSTALQNLYLNEQGVPSILLPALNFMRKDQRDEPDMYFIREIINRELAKYPDCKLFITQGYICRN